MRFDITAESLASQNFRPLHAGDDYFYRFTLVDDVGDPIDLTGAKVWFTIKESSTQADAVAKLQLSSASIDEIEIAVPVDGLFYVKFKGTGTKPTADLEGAWEYDLQVKAVISGVTKIITVIWGTIEFLPNITRATA